MPPSVDEILEGEIEELGGFAAPAVAKRLPDDIFQLDIELDVSMDRVERAVRAVLACAGGEVADLVPQGSRQLLATVIESGFLKTNAASICVGITEVAAHQTAVRIVGMEEGFIKRRAGEKAAIKVGQALLCELGLGPTAT